MNDSVYDEETWKELVLELCDDLEYWSMSEGFSLPEIVKDARHYVINGNWGGFDPLKCRRS